MRAKKPTKANLAEFEALWQSDGWAYKRLSRLTEDEAKAKLLDWHTHLWRLAGCPENFYPPSTDVDAPMRSSGGCLADRDQELYPARWWHL